MPDAPSKQQVQHCFQLASTFARLEQTNHAIEQLAKGLSLLAEQVDYLRLQNAYCAAELGRLHHPKVKTSDMTKQLMNIKPHSPKPIPFPGITP